MCTTVDQTKGALSLRFFLAPWEGRGVDSHGFHVCYICLFCYSTYLFSFVVCGGGRESFLYIVDKLTVSCPDSQHIFLSNTREMTALCDESPSTMRTASRLHCAEYDGLDKVPTASGERRTAVG